MFKIKNVRHTPISNINLHRAMPNRMLSTPTPSEFHPEYLERVQKSKQDIFSKFFRFVRSLYYANIKYR